MSLQQFLELADCRVGLTQWSRQAVPESGSSDLKGPVTKACVSARDHTGWNIRRTKPTATDIWDKLAVIIIIVYLDWQLAVIIIIIIIIKFVHEVQHKTIKNNKSKKNTLGYSVQTDLITVSISSLVNTHCCLSSPLSITMFFITPTSACKLVDTFDRWYL